MSLNDPIDPMLVTAAATAAAPRAGNRSRKRRPIGGLPSRFCCFVTGTDTEIGKTLVSAAILHKLVARRRARLRHEAGRRRRRNARRRTA